MLNLIIKSALNNRLIVLFTSIFVLIYGIYKAKNLSIDVLPELNKPTIVILTEGDGRSAKEIEALITIPLENTLRGLPGITRIKTTSSIGLSIIYLEFDWESDLTINRQLVSEKLQMAKGNMTNDANPVIAPNTGLMGNISQIAVATKDNSISPMELKTLVDSIIKPKLMSIPGIAGITVIGGDTKQYQILLDPNLMAKYQISLDKMDELEHIFSKITQNTSGGFLNINDKEILIRGLGAAQNVDDIKETVIGIHFGMPIKISDIGKVEISGKVKRGDGSYMGTPAVIMSVSKQMNSDTLKITREIEKNIEDLKTIIPDSVIIDTGIFKQSDFIERSLNGIGSKLRYGSLLVVLVLLLFLANLRMSLISLLSIPMSLCLSFTIFKSFGLSINTMTLGGLAIAIGELVDDSIVDVENIYRRLKENSKLASPLPHLKIIFKASSEVRNSIVMATLIIALVFIPLFALDGLSGKLFTPLALSYLLALFSSLLVSLTLTPVLSSFLITKCKKGEYETKFLSFIKNLDRKILNILLERPKYIFSTVLVLFLGSTSLLFFMGQDFLPKFNENNAMISLYAPPGISLSRSGEIASDIEKKLLTLPEIKTVARRTGRAPEDEHAMGVNVSEIDINFHHKNQNTISKIRKILDEVPDISYSIGGQLSHLIDHLLSGVSSNLAIKVRGHDFSKLRQIAINIRNTLRDSDNVVDVKIEGQATTPELKIYILREEAAQYGINVGEITSFIKSAFYGKAVAKMIHGQTFFDIYYRFDEKYRTSIDAINEVVVKTMPDGKKIKLNDVADIYESQDVSEIGRENGSRGVVITANITGSDGQKVVQDIQKTIKEKIIIPKDYFVSFEGQFEAQTKAFNKIMVLLVFVLVGILFILYSHFRSISISLQIFSSIPFAFIGGIVLLFLTEQTLSVSSIVGFVTLCGITCRNSIMMISHFLHLLKYENEVFSKQMIIRGALERLTPVMMTASVTTLALMPLILSGNDPGNEILYPIAIVIVGGLTTSTLLDIIVIPVSFYFFNKKGVSYV